MSKAGFVSMWIGIALLVASWLFPPWTVISGNQTLYTGFASIFSGPPLSDVSGFVSSIDYTKLAFIDISILVVAVGGMVSFRRRGIS